MRREPKSWAARHLDSVDGIAKRMDDLADALRNHLEAISVGAPGIQFLALGRILDDAAVLNRLSADVRRASEAARKELTHA